MIRDDTQESLRLLVPLGWSRAAKKIKVARFAVPAL
jgi:hypothetical protein